MNHVLEFPKLNEVFPFLKTPFHFIVIVCVLTISKIINYPFERAYMWYIVAIVIGLVCIISCFFTYLREYPHEVDTGSEGQLNFSKGVGIAVSVLAFYFMENIAPNNDFSFYLIVGMSVLQIGVFINFVVTTDMSSKFKIVSKNKTLKVLQMILIVNTLFIGVIVNIKLEREKTEQKHKEVNGELSRISPMLKVNFIDQKFDSIASVIQTRNYLRPLYGYNKDFINILINESLNEAAFQSIIGREFKDSFYLDYAGFPVKRIPLNREQFKVLKAITLADLKKLRNADFFEYGFVKKDFWEHCYNIIAFKKLTQELDNEIQTKISSNLPEIEEKHEWAIPIASKIAEKLEIEIGDFPNEQVIDTSKYYGFSKYLTTVKLFANDTAQIKRFDRLLTKIDKIHTTNNKIETISNRYSETIFFMVLCWFICLISIIEAPNELSKV